MAQAAGKAPVRMPTGASGHGQIRDSVETLTPMERIYGDVKTKQLLDLPVLLV
ncbi:MAG: hypothetical protein ACLQVJ_11935 [Syntrophobacteraceae bacterium]